MDKTPGEKSGVDLLASYAVLVYPSGRVTCCGVPFCIDVVLADRGEAMIGGQKNIRVRGDCGS